MYLLMLSLCVLHLHHSRHVLPGQVQFLILLCVEIVQGFIAGRMIIPPPHSIPPGSAPPRIGFLRISWSYLKWAALNLSTSVGIPSFIHHTPLTFPEDMPPWAYLSTFTS